MLSHNLKSIRYAGIVFCLAIVCVLIAFPALKYGSVQAGSEDAEKQMAQLKSEIERPGPVSPAEMRKYTLLASMIGTCSPAAKLIDTFKVSAPLAPLSNLCINGSVDLTDPTYGRVITTSTGTGIGTGAVGNCSLSGSGTAAHYDLYSFNLTSCAAFPTEVTATLCGPGGCAHVGNTDSIMVMYRAVPAGDALTANGGTPAAFNPGAGCTNAVAASDDIGAISGSANQTGGATCNQVTNTQCLSPCTSPSNAGSLSGMRRQLGSGRFSLVISGFGNGTVGPYNLYVDAPGAGCVVALAPSAANGGISGRVITPGGRGIGMTTVTISGGTLGHPVTALTNPFGYYSVAGLEAGQTYSVSVSAKGYQFAESTRIITVQDDLAGVDFVSIQ